MSGEGWRRPLYCNGIGEDVDDDDAVIGGVVSAKSVIALRVRLQTCYLPGSLTPTPS